MSVDLIRTLDTLILPPGGPILVILAGLLLWRWRTWSLLFIGVGLTALYLFSTPLVASLLMAPIEPYEALTDAELEDTPAQAILVLCGGRYENAPEFGGDTVSPRLLARLRYAAWLQRRTELPIIVSGGTRGIDGPPEAHLARQVLEDELGARVSMLEDQSLTTWENARLTQPLLKRQGIDQILLVTHAWHLPRAVYAFREAGVQVIPAPTHFVHSSYPGKGLVHWLPSAGAMYNSYYALHERLGLLWYKLRYADGT
jgi:uncharacterized SAM-binding protein YcdF (DUF218 family)